MMTTIFALLGMMAVGAAASQLRAPRPQRQPIVLHRPAQKTRAGGLTARGTYRGFH